MAAVGKAVHLTVTISVGARQMDRTKPLQTSVDSQEDGPLSRMEHNNPLKVYSNPLVLIFPKKCCSFITISLTVQRRMLMKELFFSLKRCNPFRN